MNPSVSKLIDARVANISRVTELWETTYLPVETIAIQTGLSVKLVTTIIEETGVTRLRVEPTKSTTLLHSIEQSQANHIMELYNKTTLSIKAISKERGVFYKYSQVAKVIHANTTKEERELRRMALIRKHGGLDVFIKAHGVHHTTRGNTANA